jgi:hypothetical protein
MEAIQELWNIRPQPRFRVDAVTAVLPVGNYVLFFFFLAVDGIRFKLLLENGFYCCLMV